VSAFLAGFGPAAWLVLGLLAFVVLPAAWSVFGPRR
jgi:hypothetical protein